MSEAPEVPAKPVENMMALEPDTFWELIEKLLLKASHDEKKRTRHNVSVSALCRGHAQPRLSRVKQTQKEDSTDQTKDNKSRKVLKASKKNDSKPSERTLNASIAERKIRPSHSTNATAKATKSECNISDSRVIYVKDPEIPESERLWRFALRNRQQKQESEENYNDLKPIPSARNNEAIFEGLKKRLEDARKQEDEEPKITGTCSKTKQNRKRFKATRHKCEKHAIYNGNMSANRIINRKKSKSFTSPIRIPQATEPPLVKQHASSPNFAHDLRRTPVMRLLEASETERLKPTQDFFESKKSQYHSALKRRLRCGNQLERLNREIVCKKMNPRMAPSRETTRKYMDLKADYLNFCYQESSLRHQIAMLHAHIYMLQNNHLHKRPAAVKTITLDSKSAKVPPKADTNYIESHPSSNEQKVLLFPRLKPPRPLIMPLQKSGFDQFYDRLTHSKKWSTKKETSFSTQKSESREECHCNSVPSINKDAHTKGVCSLYLLTTSLQLPPKRQPPALLLPEQSQIDEIETKHRLPKMSASLNSCKQSNNY